VERRFRSLGRQRPVRVLRCTVLEGQDGAILDDTVTDLDGPTNGGVRVPGAMSSQDRSKERSSASLFSQVAEFHRYDGLWSTA
jgi:hypothetical protein